MTVQETSGRLALLRTRFRLNGALTLKQELVDSSCV